MKSSDDRMAVPARARQLGVERLLQEAMVEQAGQAVAQRQLFELLNRDVQLVGALAHLGLEPAVDVVQLVVLVRQLGDQPRVLGLEPGLADRVAERGRQLGQAQRLATGSDGRARG